MNGWIPLFLGLAVLALTFMLVRMPLRYWAIGIEGERYKRIVRAFSLPWFFLMGIVCLLAGFAKLVGWRPH